MFVVFVFVCVVFCVSTTSAQATVSAMLPVMQAPVLAIFCFMEH